MNIAVLFQGMATVAWFAVVGIVIFAVVRASRNRPLPRSGVWIMAMLIIAIVFSTVSAGIVLITPQERGVVLSVVSPGGVRSEALQPGLNWIIPFAESVVRYPVYKQTYTMSIAGTEGNIQGDDSIAARTADGQEIYVDASVIYSVNPAEVVKVHIAWQDRYTDDLVRAQARGIIRDAVSQYGVEEVVSSKRFDLVNQIREVMGKKLADNGLVMDDFVLRNIAFSTDYAASVEQKQIAEQLSQQAKFVVEQKRQEADQAREVAKGAADASVTRAQGEAQAVIIAAEADAKARVIQAQAEAEALKLIAEALKTNPNLLSYQYITKLSPNVQVMLLPGGENASPFIFTLPQVGPAPAPAVTTQP